MKNLNILLLEDLEDDAKALQQTLESNNYKVTHVKNIQEAESKLRTQFFDMMILDIMIDGQPQGIQLADKINKKGIEIPFLFLTSMQGKAIFEEAKFTNPTNYLLKPFNELELLYALDLAIESYYGQENSISLDSTTAIVSPKHLFIKKSRSVVKVEVSEINFIEVEEKYCSLKCDEGNYLIKMSLKKINELLNNENFKQVHRNYLVNIKKIKEIYFEDSLIILNNRAKIPFSERYKALFKKQNNIFN